MCAWCVYRGQRTICHRWWLFLSTIQVLWVKLRSSGWQQASSPAEQTPHFIFWDKVSQWTFSARLAGHGVPRLSCFLCPSTGVIGTATTSSALCDCRDPNLCFHDCTANMLPMDPSLQHLHYLFIKELKLFFIYCGCKALLRYVNWKTFPLSCALPSHCLDSMLRNTKNSPSHKAPLVYWVATRAFGVVSRT